MCKVELEKGNILMCRYRMFLFLSLIFMATLIQAQKSVSTIKGVVINRKGEPVPFATLAILNTTVGAVTNESGQFTLQVSQTGKQHIVTRCLGYQEQILSIAIKEGETSNLQVILTSGSTNLNEVVVSQKSETKKLKDLPFAVTTISVKPLQVRNLDVNGILNTTTGVKIREEGGLGSGFTFSLNGFSGNQIKFFIDGIPMDNFGSSLSLNNIPVNLISSIEVYKGVIPVELGMDALGGAVNIVTNTHTKNFFDFAYSFGSFNTHRTSLVSRYTAPKSGFQVNANVFHNYSDNNYKIMAEIPDPETGSIGEAVEVKRFNDAYKSLTAQLELGVIDKSYADKLLLGVVVSSNRKEVQTGYNMTKVGGQVYTTSERFILSLKYAKKDFITKKLNARLYATYIKGEDLVADTSSRQYDWYGHYTMKEFGTSGELTWDKTLFQFNDKSAMGTANLNYTLSPSHSFSLNSTYIYFNRQGEDPISYNAVPFSEPNTINKNINGLAYNQNLFGGKLKSSFFAKLFIMDAQMYEQAGSGSEKDLSEINNHTINSGGGVATTYFVSPNFQFKASYENTYRLPETLELFGDGLNLLANPNLTPEKSKNLNFRVAYNKRINDSRFFAEATYLYRLPENLIRVVAEGNQAWYENYDNAKINSVEGEFKYSYKNKFRFNVNGTYQNVVDNNKTTSTGGKNYLYGIRLANIPYLFGNATAGYQFSTFGNSKNKASIDWSTQFVESFYLKTPNQGSVNTKKEIPRQFSHNVSISFMFDSGKYNVSFGCTNLMNSELYDNFKLQKPGRAYSVKLRYFISK